MFEIIALVLVPLGLAIAGIAILGTWSQGPSGGRAARPDWLSDVASAVGWVLLILGLFAVVGVMANALCIVAWIVTAVVLLSLKYRLRSAERRSLLWVLMVAAQRRIPLETAARAFAEERHDWMGSRALDLAAYLEAGQPLALALKRSRLAFPQAVILGAELGQQTGCLGDALRQVLGHNDESELVLRSAMERAFYILFLAIFSLFMWAFLILKIMPTLQKIQADFKVDLPPSAVWSIGIGHTFVNYWPLFLPIGIICLIALVRGLSYYTGYSTRYLPGLNPSWRRADRSVIMRWLALAVRRNRPLSDMMRLIAGYLVGHRLRRKLETAARRIDQGAEWTECLRRAGLIRTAEAAVFRSAERTGNLAWALEEMSQSSNRRAVYQLRALVNLVFPAAIVLMGGPVLLAIFAVLGTMIHLIEAF